MRRAVLSSILLLSWASPALSLPLIADITGTDNVAKSVSGSGEVVTVTDTGVLATTGTAITLSGSSPAPGITIDNAGTISSSTSRGIDTSGGNGTRTYTLNNREGALLSGSNDAFRINVDATVGTITVDNAGTIVSTGGQALDFNSIETGTATVSITNQSTGLIRAATADAIRPGQGATVTNFGTICVGTFSAGACSGGVVGESHDGVDWQDFSGTLINKTGGVISGQHHGTTSDVNVDVTNEAGAQIVGRNGSGVGSDGSGTVINHGTIRGEADGVAADGDGDGVDIDDIAGITNFGVIEGTGATGVDSGGQPNGSEGIAIGGGMVDNKGGARITGANTAMLVDDGSAGSALAATTVINAGRIEGLDGLGIKLVGDFADTIDNAGVIAGTLGAIDMGDGDDTLKLRSGSDIQGLSDGGLGFDTIEVLEQVALGEAVNFEQLILDATAVLELTFDLHIAKLVGAAVDVAGDTITNIVGNGFNFYYDQYDPDNAYLAGRTFQLSGGGAVLAAVPEPSAVALLLPALMVLIGAGRRRRRAAA